MVNILLIPRQTRLCITYSVVMRKGSIRFPKNYINQVWCRRWLLIPSPLGDVPDECGRERSFPQSGDFGWKEINSYKIHLLGAYTQVGKAREYETDVLSRQWADCAIISYDYLLSLMSETCSRLKSAIFTDRYNHSVTLISSRCLH